MDKRIVRTQAKAEKALFELMQEQNFSEISITDIANQAKISRMAFYRNYNSKEDILNKFIQKEYATFVDDITTHQFKELEQLLEVYFDYFKNNPAVLSAIVNASIEGFALQKQSDYLLDFFKMRIKNQQPAPIEIAYYSGAIFASLLYWRENDYQYSAVELAEQLAEKIKNDLLQTGEKIF
ncbi:TetR/AcrR family transcriptional regulator [Pediococcus acidilactici]|uniref:TetR/AcrR family transcriptional regulator n=1 Tax=Pediococcus acidilactici TaxID=1254 RepID=UPI00200A5080|nr:TetR/AcrR family transcriptional regulator [Pediococcus acidilactici]UPU33974.1 TetR/AcrR family transcriptional regulator [Pediococcus acidilactici]